MQLSPASFITPWGWIKLYNDELHNFYYSQNISSKIKSRSLSEIEDIYGAWEVRNAYRILVEESEGKGPLERQKSKG
jgi:hypothetical protein